MEDVGVDEWGRHENFGDGPLHKYRQIFLTGYLDVAFCLQRDKKGNASVA